ncbi:MAG: AsmA family protein, partial [Pseudomonadota bacterium]|nr:AsmA family protein [Pseudomonadota bacterium]
AVVFVCALALITVRPAALDTDTLRGNMTRKIAAWSGGQLAISGPIRFSYFPTISVEAEQVQIQAPGRIPMVIEITAEKLRVDAGFWSLIWPNADLDRLVLDGAIVRLRQQGATPDVAPPQKDEFRLFKALQESPVESVILQRSKIVLAGEQREETIELASGNIRIYGGTGAVTTTGKATWRERSLTFAFTADAPRIDKGTAAIPVRLTAESPIASASMEAMATVASGIQLAGKMDVNIADLSQFARWLGLLLPEDSRPHRFVASGSFDWDKDLLGFDDGTFVLDGNKAIGTMAVKFAETRPRIEGTLAFQRFELPLLPADSGTPKPKSAPSTDGFAWMHHFDADLRISTVSLATPALEIGQAAIATVLRSGQLDADFAVLDLCGGKANGRVEYNAAVPEGRARLVTNIDDLSAKRCLTSLAGSSPVRGVARISADITSDGRNFAALMERLAGSVSVSLSEAEVDVDVSRIVPLASKSDVKGWAPLLGRSTTLTKLDGQFVLRRSIAYSNALTLETPEKATLTAEGTTDLATGDVDYFVVVENVPTTAGNAESTAQPPRLHVSGSWLRPNFQLERMRAGSRDTPSLNQTLTQFD